MTKANADCWLILRSIFWMLPLFIYTCVHAQFITTVAGNGSHVPSGDGGPATCAGMHTPTGICVNSNGDLYIICASVIRKVDGTTGIITTIAGDGIVAHTGDGGLAVNARLEYPTSVATDAADNLYITDYHTIRKINAVTGIITTIVGTGQPGFGGDGGPAINARLNSCKNVLVDAAGNIYIADSYNHRIRKVTAATGIISTIAGNGDPFTSSGDGGPAVNAGMPDPNGLALDATGNIYFTEVEYGFTSRLRKITAATGIITTLAGNNNVSYSGDGGPAVNATLNDPTNICMDAAGNIYLSEIRGSRIRKITAATNIINTIVGNGTDGFAGDRGPAVGGLLNTPIGICTDAAGNIYIADALNYRIRKITATLPPIAPPVVPAVSISAPAATICTGGSLTFTATVVNGGANPDYTWKRNGVTAGTNSGTYTATALNNGDAVTCTVTATSCDGSSQTVSSNTITITTGAPAVPAVTINTTATTVCSGRVVTFTATPVNAGTNPAYQWRLNGINTGANSKVYASSTLTDGDILSCILTTDPAFTCVSTTTAISGTIRMTVQAAQTPAVNITTPATTVCGGTAVTFTAAAQQAGGSPVYQWQLNGVNTGTNSNQYTANALSNGDAITCVVTADPVLTCVASANATSNTIRMTVPSVLTPAVNIAASAQRICRGTAVTFTAAPRQAGASPVYQWKLNGTGVGTNSPQYASSTLADGDIITCVITADPALTCVTTTSATSGTIKMTVSAALTPTINITASAQTICSGTAVTFNATAQQAGTLPVYQWQVNGVNAGAGSNQYTSNALSDGDMVRCMLTTDPLLACVTGGTAVSNTIVVTVATALAPAINITASARDICAGTPVTFTAVAQQAGTAPVYQWMLNGANTGSNSAAYTNVSPADGDQVYCVLTTTGVCPVAPVNSNTIAVTVSAPPVLTISPPDTTVIRAAQVQLLPVVQGAAVASFEWSPAAGLTNPLSFSPVTRPLTADVDYNLRVVAVNGCAVSAKVIIRVLARGWTMPNVFSPNGDGRNDVFRMPPGTSFDLKEFTIYDRWGKTVFVTRSVDTGWDGKVNGIPEDAGTYIYVIYGKGEQAGVVLRGSVTLLR